MPNDTVTRKLTAILYADAVAYSRLTGADEVGTHRQLSASLDLISRIIEASNGRVVHYAGDAVLAEFQSVVAAVETAVNIQSALAEISADIVHDERVMFRIGVNIGEIIVDRDDIYGDGVNVAARLEALAKPGGVCISGLAYDQVDGKLDLNFEDMGQQDVKNIARPVHAYLVTTKTQAASSEPSQSSAPETDLPLHQEVKFCTAPDGVQIAYSSVGNGPPLIKTANWLNHLEYDFESPVWSHIIKAFASNHTLIRFDQRGNGLSDWDAEDVSFDAWVQDLETVADAAGHQRFAILGISQGCAAAVTYAVRHPERVSHLVLYGGYLRGRDHRGSKDNMAQEEAMISLISSGWGQDNPAFRQIFTSLFVPDASPEQMNWFNELQRRTTTPENAMRLRRTQNSINITELAPKITTPTLVLHARNDAVAPFEEGRRMAAAIPGARFITLEGRNHVVLENEPDWPRLRDEITAFLKT